MVKKVQPPTTSFQVHHCCDDNVVDYTAARLRRVSKQTNNANLKQKLNDLLDMYMSGCVAVAWSNGQPTFHNLISNK